jgi:hypothetical protein
LSLRSDVYRATAGFPVGELVVEPDEGRLAISYRASFPIGDDRLRLRCVEFREGTAPTSMAQPG